MQLKDSNMTRFLRANNTEDDSAVEIFRMSYNNLLVQELELLNRKTPQVWVLQE